MNDIERKIKELKKEKNAVILAHNYQLPEIQDLSDILGDSLDLSKTANTVKEDIIVFCGVRFMAETAKILSPEKKVLLPVYDAGCPMADMVSADELKKFKAKHPDYYIVSYVNTTAEVKAVSDICCTSANAEKIVKNIPADKILFVPDENLGAYVKSKVPEKEIKLWEGYCNVHVRINAGSIMKAKEIHPNAVLLVHPEAPKEVRNIADYLMSTNQMVKFAKESADKEFLIGTEKGMIYRLQKENPDKKFYSAGMPIVCPNMKKTRLNDVYNALKYEQYEIVLSEDIIKNAKAALENMLNYS